MLSTLEWKGLHPQRFEVGRKHLKPQDQLVVGQLNQGTFTSLEGKKHFSPKRCGQFTHKPSIKPFPYSYQETTLQVPISQRKTFDFKPTEKPPRPERLHVREGRSGHLEDIPIGIHATGLITKSSEKNYQLQEKLQRKARVDDPVLMRNGLGVISLGDKPYKYPEQMSNFYDEGGLVPGSSIRPRKERNQFKETIPASTKVSSGKLTWTERLKQEEAELDRRDVDQLEKWVEHTLKEARPDYKDPELFFQLMEQKKDLNQKKGSKK